MNVTEALAANYERARQIQLEVQMIAADRSADPAKPEPGSIGGAKAWAPINAAYKARIADCNDELAELIVERRELQKQMSQTPVSKYTLGRIISDLVVIESKFTEGSSDEAWDMLTVLIDRLELDSARVVVEEQVEKLEAAA